LAARIVRAALLAPPWCPSREVSSGDGTENENIMTLAKAREEDGAGLDGNAWSLG
jgi:hypothetical protein